MGPEMDQRAAARVLAVHSSSNPTEVWKAFYNPTFGRLFVNHNPALTQLKN